VFDWLRVRLDEVDAMFCRASGGIVPRARAAGVGKVGESDILVSGIWIAVFNPNFSLNIILLPPARRGCAFNHLSILKGLN
jgi:hypothetical protein